MSNVSFVKAINFEDDQNFWSINPELKYMSGFKPIWDIDKGGDDSSRIMWSIYLFTDIKSKFRRMSEKNRILEIEDFYGKDVISFDNPLIEKAILYYRKVCLTTAQRNFVEWEDILNERTEYIKNLPWRLDEYQDINGRSTLVKGTASEKDAMLSRTSKYWEMYSKLKEQMEKEEASGTLKGGGQKSFLESLN